MMQCTISKSVSLDGVGIFSGNSVKLTLTPAGPDSGIIFIRTDLPEAPRLPLKIENITSNYRRTCLVKNNASVETIEHLLSALSGLGIDNLEISLTNAELPVGDGSPHHFVELIQSAGIVQQDVARRVITLKQPLAVQSGHTSLIALPTEEDYLTLDFTLEYQEPIIGTQHLTITLTPDNYVKELSQARSFCLTSEIEEFTNQGLGKGGNYQNTLVVDNNKVIANKLRFPNEFVRHKILDLVGDLYILNAPVVAHIIAVKSGHETNLQLVRKINQVITASPGILPKSETLLDIRQIQNILPHRYPFLLLDRVIEMQGYSRAVGIKNVTINEPYFQGHFPGQPVMPAVLQIEAMAQLAGALLIRRAGNEDKLGVLLAIDGVKLRKSIVPGDQLRIEAETVRSKSRTAELATRILVDGELAAEANLKFMLVDRE